MPIRYALLAAVALLCALMGSTAAGAESVSTEELAKEAQNPVAKLISIPFQNNINFNAGSQSRTQNILNIQPVIPISLGPDWNLITRTIVPVISQPVPDPFGSRINGIGAPPNSRPFFLPTTTPDLSGALVPSFSSRPPPTTSSVPRISVWVPLLPC